MGNLCLVVPCYNEEEVFKGSADSLEKKINELIDHKKIGRESRILFVNDGSADRTWEYICQRHKESARVSGISLSRNFGHQNAVLAGLMYVVDSLPQMDITISIDADLQQDINAIDEFVKQWENGAEIVYGVRNDRNTDGFLKKVTALGFYKFMNMLGCNTIKNHADYRLISRKALLVLREYKETNIFLRGLIPTLGFKTGVVHFDVHARTAGKSKYNLHKMIGLAIDGITSFSTKPMKIICVTGLVAVVISVIQLICIVVGFLYGGDLIKGWASTMCSVWLFGGLILFALGVIGEYIGKIYLETKSRPRYIISDDTEHLERNEQRETSC